MSDDLIPDGPTEGCLAVPPEAQRAGELALLMDLIQQQTIDVGTLTVHRRSTTRKPASSGKTGWDFRIPADLKGFVPHPGYYEVLETPGNRYPHLYLNPCDTKPPKDRVVKCSLQAPGQWRFSIPFHPKTLKFIEEYWGLPADHESFYAIVKIVPDGAIALARPSPDHPDVQDE